MPLEVHLVGVKMVGVSLRTHILTLILTYAQASCFPPPTPKSPVALWNGGGYRPRISWEYLAKPCTQAAMELWTLRLWDGAVRLFGSLHGN